MLREGYFPVRVFYSQLHTVLFLQRTVHQVDNSPLDLVLDSVQTDNFAAHQVIGLLFGLDGVLDDLDFFRLES
jgi:hypothetical protein